MKTIFWAPVALLILASGLQASSRSEVAFFDPMWLEDLDGPRCRADSSSEHRSSRTAMLQIYRDPVTGRFEVPPPTVRVELPRALEIRPRALVETRVAVPGGGVRVDLSDRFATALVVTRGADGKGKVECARHPPPPRARDEPLSEEDRR